MNDPHWAHSVPSPPENALLRGKLMLMIFPSEWNRNIMPGMDSTTLLSMLELVGISTFLYCNSKRDTNQDRMDRIVFIALAKSHIR